MKTTRRFWGMIGVILLAGLLTACDPAGFPYLEVNRVGIIDQQPYIHVYLKWSLGLRMDDPKPGPYFTSLDEGQSWQGINAPPGDPLPVSETPPGAEVVACVPSQPQVCYRLRGQPGVEISTDGGKSWQIDWQIPAGRQEYQVRQPEMEYLLRVYPDIIPYDLAILETGDGHVVLVAYGNQGMLVKTTDGAWSRIAVLADDPEVRSAIPLPYQAPDLDTAMQVLASESTYLLLLALLGLTLFASVGWTFLVKKAGSQKPSTVDGLSLLALLSGTAFILTGFLFMTAQRGDATREIGLLNSGLAQICLLPAIILMVVLFAVGSNLPNQKYVWRVGLLALGLAIGFFVLTWLPFGLWAWGVIPRYAQAWIGVGVLVLVDLVFSFLAISSFVRRAPVPAEVVKGDELHGQENIDSSSAEE